MQLEVSLYGSSDLGEVWLWWASVFVARDDGRRWLDSTGTLEDPREVLLEAFRIVRTDVALPERATYRGGPPQPR